MLPGETRARMRRAGRREVRREWERFQGNPYRQLLLDLRAKYLREAITGTPLVNRTFLEVGPGPGRFTGVLGEHARTLLLVDLSPKMLGEARRRIGPGSPAVVHTLGADAVRLPIRSGCVGACVALGNLVGFVEEELDWVLEEMTRVLAPGGLLVVEAVDGAVAGPRWLSSRSPSRLREALSLPTVEGAMERLLSEGWTGASSPVAAGLSPHHFPAVELRRRLLRLGFQVTGLRWVAPLTGSLPDLVNEVGRDPVLFPRILALEEAAGRDPGSSLSRGPYLLTAVSHTQGGVPGGPSRGGHRT